LMLAQDSPRRIDQRTAAELADLPVLKVGVVVSELGQARQWLADGLLDAVQFHGEQQPEECYAAGFPYYKAVRASGQEAVAALASFHCPRVLVDAYVPTKAGGTGTRVPDDLVRAVAGGGQLWLAGGLGPDNVARIIADFQPELVDASSRLESEPGRKDPAKLRAYFAELPV